MNPSEIVKISPFELEDGPGQPRTNLGDLEELAKSLQQGQVQPILAYRKGQRYVILEGHRRVHAARLANLPTVEVILRDEPSVDDALVLGLTANIARKSLTPIEQALGFARAIEQHDWSQAKIAETVGVTETQVSKLLSLLRLPAAVQKLVGSELPVTIAYEIANIGGEEDQVRLANEVVKQQLTREQFLARLSRKGRKKPKVSGKRALHAFIPLEGGCVMHLSLPEGTTLLELIGHFECVIAKAHKASKESLELPAFLAQTKSKVPPARSKKRKPSKRAPPPDDAPPLAAAAS